MHEMLFKTQI